jgi:bla regulator protein BlaR1
MSLHALLHTASSATETLAPALANHLWQSTVFAAVAGLLTLALRRNQACIRYSLWLAASLKFLIPFSLLVVLGSHLQRPHAPTPQAAAVYVAMEQVSQPFPDQPIVVSSQNAPATPTLGRTETLELSLAALWLTGSICFLLRWLVRWRQMCLVMRQAIPTSQGREFDLLRQLAETLALNTRITLLLSPSPLGPGVCGIARPKLIWPSGISLRLDDAHLKTVMAHELCHVRRRDNLTAALHMLVETVFWFHPMVWWLGARLIDERERACDESVLELTGQPRIYAESILKICEFYVEPPLACVSGVTGADLKARLVNILDRHAILKLSRTKITLLIAVALIAIAVPIMLGQANATRRLALAAVLKPVLSSISPEPSQPLDSLLLAAAQPVLPAVQAQDTPAPDFTAPDEKIGPSFEVATIRPANRNDGRRFFGIRLDASGRLSGSAVLLSQLVAAAYVIEPGKQAMSGGPAWANSEEFDINAKVDAAYMDGWDKLSEAQRMDRVKPMIRALLAERFHLKLRTEMHDQPVYALVQAKGGTKMKEVPAPPPPPKVEGDPGDALDAAKRAMDAFKQQQKSGNGFPPGQAGCLTATTCSGAAVQVSRVLGMMRARGWVDRFVIDRTGLNGYYDFSFTPPSTNFAVNRSAGNGDETPPFVQIGEELGLRFEPTKVPMKTYIIESAQKPSLDGAEPNEPPPTTLKPVAFAQEKPTPPPTPAANTPYVPTLTFDVVSIHESKPEEVHRRGGGYGAHSELMIMNMPVLWLVRMAYGVNTRDISGQPGWAGQTDFVVNAKSDAAADQKLATLSKEQVSLERQHMVQTLLADRFNLKMHWETREADVYNLVLAKGGSKLQPPGSMKPSPGERWPGDSKTPPPMHQQGDRTLGFEFYGHDFPIEGLGQLMSSMFGRDVVNKTGLTGGFDFHIQYLGTRARDRKDDDTNPLPTFEDAMQDQLGLKLEPAKGPVQVLVIDHIEKPSPN